MDERAALTRRQQHEFQELWQQGFTPRRFGDAHAKVLSRRARFLKGAELVAEVEVEFVKNARLMEWGALWSIVIAGRCMASALEPLIQQLTPGQPVLEERPPFAVRSRLDPDFMPPMNREGTFSVVADSDMTAVADVAREAIANGIEPLLRRYHDGDLGVIDDVLRRKGRGYRAPAATIAAACILNKDLARFEQVSATKRFKQLDDARDIRVEALRAQVGERSS